MGEVWRSIPRKRYGAGSKDMGQQFNIAAETIAYLLRLKEINAAEAFANNTLVGLTLYDSCDEDNNATFIASCSEVPALLVIEATYFGKTINYSFPTGNGNSGRQFWYKIQLPDDFPFKEMITFTATFSISYNGNYFKKSNVARQPLSFPGRPITIKNIYHDDGSSITFDLTVVNFQQLVYDLDGIQAGLLGETEPGHFAVSESENRTVRYRLLSTYNSGVRLSEYNNENEKYTIYSNRTLGNEPTSVLSATDDPGVFRWKLYGLQKKDYRISLAWNNFGGYGILKTYGVGHFRPTCTVAAQCLKRGELILSFTSSVFDATGTFTIYPEVFYDVTYYAIGSGVSTNLIRRHSQGNLTLLSLNALLTYTVTVRSYINSTSATPNYGATSTVTAKPVTTTDLNRVLQMASSTNERYPQKEDIIFVWTGAAIVNAKIYLNDAILVKSAFNATVNCFICTVDSNANNVFYLADYLGYIGFAFTQSATITPTLTQQEYFSVPTALKLKLGPTTKIVTTSKVVYELNTFLGMITTVNKTADEFLTNIATLDSQPLTNVQILITGSTLNLTFAQYNTYRTISQMIISPFTITGNWNDPLNQYDNALNNPSASFIFRYSPPNNNRFDNELANTKINTIYLSRQVDFSFDVLNSSIKAFLTKVATTTEQRHTYKVWYCPVSKVAELKNELQNATGNFVGVITVYDTTENLANWVSPSGVISISSGGTVNYEWSLTVVETILLYTTAVTVHNVPAAEAGYILRNNKVNCIIVDTVSNFIENFDSLTRFGNIEYNLTGTEVISITDSQYENFMSIYKLNIPFFVRIQYYNYWRYAKLNHPYAKKIISDTPSIVSTYFKNINLTASIYAVECTDLHITYGQYTSYASAVSKLINTFTLTLVSCDAAKLLVNSNNPLLRISVSDRTEILRNNATTLQSSIITHVTATNTSPSFMYDYSTSVLPLVLKSTNIHSVVSVPAAAAFDINNGLSPKPSVTFSVSDSKDAILSVVTTLNSCTSLSGITVTDNFIIPVATFASNLNAMSKLTTACSIYDLSVTATSTNLLLFANAKILTAIVAASIVEYTDFQYVSKLRSNFQVINVPASKITSVISNTYVTSITVSDNSVGILSYLPTLNANMAKITAISCDTAISVQYSQYFSNTTVFAAFTSSVSISNAFPCSAISDTTITLPPTFTIADFSNIVLDNLNLLSSVQSRIIMIIASGVIRLTYAQTLTYPFLLNKLSSSFTVSDAPVSAVQTLLAISTLSGFTVSDTANYIETLQTNQNLTAVTVSSGTISYTAFARFSSLLTSAVSVKDAVVANLPTLQTNYLRLIAVINDVPMQVTVANLSSAPQVIPLLANSSQTKFILNDFASIITSNISIVQNSGVTKILLKDSTITIQAFQDLLPVHSLMADLKLSDTAANIAAALAYPPSSLIVDMYADSTFTIEKAILQNASLVRTNFTVSNVPIANLVSVLSNTNVTKVTILDASVTVSNSIDMLNTYSTKIQSISLTDSSPIQMSISVFRSATFRPAMPSSSIVVSNASNSDLSFLNLNSLVLSRVDGIGVMNIDTVIAYPDAIRKAGSVDVVDTSSKFLEKLTNVTLNASVNYIRSIDAGDVFLTYAQTQNAIVSKLAAYSIALGLSPIAQFYSVLSGGAEVNVSDTALTIQGNWPIIMTNASKIKSIIVNNSGNVELDVASVSNAVVLKMPNLSIIVTDQAAKISNLAALTTYASKIKSFSVTGTLSVEYESFNLGLAGKLTSAYSVLNVPVSMISTIVSTYASVSVRDYSYNIQASLTSLRSNISKINSVVKIDSAPISVDAATFLANGDVFKLVAGTITDNKLNVQTKFSEINAYVSSNANSIAGIVVQEFVIAYATLTANPTAAKLLSTTYVVTGVPVSAVSAVVNTIPNATVQISDLLSVVFERKVDLQAFNSKIESVIATNNVDVVINKATSNTFTFLRKLSYA